MSKEYDRSCDCPEWVEGVDKVPSHLLDNLRGILELYPDTCPYCKTQLKKRPKPTYICVATKPELGSQTDIRNSHFITLEELVERMRGK